MKTGLERIVTERHRQTSVEGYSRDHDDQHTDQSLLAAAIAYCEHVRGCNGLWQWPWSIDSWKPSGNKVETLAKAGALIAAEIDRLQRNRTTDSAKPYEHQKWDLIYSLPGCEYFESERFDTWHELQQKVSGLIIDDRISIRIQKVGHPDHESNEI
jgi:hypothetical protein